MKRLFDIVVAAIVLVALLPVFAVIAGAILITDPGPIIYRGTRVGRGGRLFQIYKFRTMTVSATGTSPITVSNDTRVTSIGRILRATKLDELPQLINVLRGDMSLVGPRPESPHYVAYYTAEQRAVLNVRPGITGAAQVLFRHEERILSGPDPEWYYITTVMPAKLEIDLAYVRQPSLWRDLQIIALTLAALVRPIKTPLLPRATAPLPVVAGHYTVPAGQESTR